LQSQHIQIAASTYPALPAIILALGHQSWGEASFWGVNFYATGIRSLHISGCLPLHVLTEAWGGGMIFPLSLFVCLFVFNHHRTVQDIKKFTSDFGFKNELSFRRGQLSAAPLT